MRKVTLLVFTVLVFTGCIAPEPAEDSPGHVPDSPVENNVPEATPPTAKPSATVQPPAESVSLPSPHVTGVRTEGPCRGECHPDYPWPKLLDIPVYEQEYEDGCGQAVLQMALAYYGINRTQKQISKEMKFGKTYPHDLAAYLEKQGLSATILELGDETWEFDPYAGRHPVIVLDHGTDIPLHWMLMEGRGEFGYVLIDPDGGRRNWIPDENHTVIVVEGPV